MSLPKLEPITVINIVKRDFSVVGNKDSLCFLPTDFPAFDMTWEEIYFAVSEYRKGMAYDS